MLSCQTNEIPETLSDDLRQTISETIEQHQQKPGYDSVPWFWAFWSTSLFRIRRAPVMNSRITRLSWGVEAFSKSTLDLLISASKEAIFSSIVAIVKRGEYV
jgi:hypothetical protein